MHNSNPVLALFQVWFRDFSKDALYFVFKNRIKIGQLMSSFENVIVKGFNLILRH